MRKQTITPEELLARTLEFSMRGLEPEEKWQRKVAAGKLRQKARGFPAAND